MDQIVYLVLGFLGVLAHSLMKSSDIQKDAKAANVEFGFKDYLKADWKSIGLSFISVLVWFFVFGEVATHYPKIENWVMSSFFVMGMVGSYVIQKLLNVSKSRIRNVVDKKTNLADGKE